MILMAIGIILTVTPATRKNETSGGCLCVIIMGTWIDKGLGMISGGFVPNPLHEVNEYAPTMPEIGITLGVYAIGALVLTVLYKSSWASWPWVSNLRAVFFSGEGFRFIAKNSCWAG
jgi:Ni/Fe-hydrogenase subunit HybB-like protein